MIGKILKINKEKNAVIIEFNEIVSHNIDEKVEVKKKQSKRSTKQNNFYWSFLTWCIHSGLQDRGHFSVEALHEDCKAWYKETYKQTINEDFSTTDMNKTQFGLYFNSIQYELMIGFFELDISGFVTDYELYRKWLEYNPDGKFKEFLESK